MSERDELTGKTLGEFVLRERIGEGGFGTVYRAEQPLLGREAVVKILHRQLRANDNVLQRFLREAKLASRLDHPYAAHVYAFGHEPDGVVWIAMEMVRGTPLDAWIADKGPLSIDEMVPLFERLAEVVHSVHEHGIVHRDLKPSNVMVTSRAGRLLPKLLDLGIAKMIDEQAPDDASATATVPAARDPVTPGAIVTRPGVRASMASPAAHDATMSVEAAQPAVDAKAHAATMSVGAGVALGKDVTMAAPAAPTRSPIGTPIPDARVGMESTMAADSAPALPAIPPMDLVSEDDTKTPPGKLFARRGQTPSTGPTMATTGVTSTPSPSTPPSRTPSPNTPASSSSTSLSASVLARLTQAGATIGSPPYMAPEQWVDAWSAGPRADLYSLGILAYECLSGRRPFTAQTAIGYQEEHTHAKVPPIGERLSLAAPALDRFFARALAKKADDRWPTALELAAAFRVACGKSDETTTLPQLEPAVRDAWLADAPEPLAGAISVLDAARNAHQAREAAWDVVRAVVRYLLALALATRAQIRGEADSAQLVDLLRTMRSRELVDEERVRLLRLLVRPFVGKRGAYPIPELVDLVGSPKDPKGAGSLTPGELHVLDRLFELRTASDANQRADDLVRSHLTRLLPTVAQFLRATSFILDYPLVVTTPDSARTRTVERWTGLRRARRPAVALADTAAATSLYPRRAMVIDREGKVVQHFYPVAQLVSPSAGLPDELFVFDGRGRHGALMIASPAGYEHHDPTLWDWLGEYAIGDAEAAETRSEDTAPYLGLATFQTADADRFVGREREVDAFVNRLRGQALQVVVGASGAGKSSFVHAGVIPALPKSWRVVTLRPGASPVHALESRLASLDLATTDLDKSPNAVVESIRQLERDRGAGLTIVIVVDQTEELFTACTDEAERLRFATMLAQLSSSADAPIRVIATIRDDFLMKLEALPPLRATLSSSLVLLGNPSVDDLVRTVVEPARRVGYSLSDDELARDMATTVAERPGALALLSFTASQLWELRDRRFKQLTRTAYDAMGGVGGALGKHAEATLENVAADDQKLVRETFCRLVTSEGTRALVSPTELRQVLASPRADTVIEKLVAARLIVMVDAEGDGRVELVHEALVTAWPRLGTWLREDADGARMRDQLTAAARQWHDRGRKKDLLWRGDTLAELERWRRRPNAIALADVETAFAEASRNEAARTRRIRRGLVVTAFAILAIAIVVLVRLNTKARENAALAAANATKAAASAAESQRRLADQYEEQGRLALLADRSGAALVYFLAAIEQGAPRTSALDFMLEQARRRLEKQDGTLTGHTARILTVALSPDEQSLATGSTDGTMRIWNLETRTSIVVKTGDPVVSSVTWSPDGSQLVTTGHSGVPRLFSKTGVLQFELAHQGQPPVGMSPAFSKHGTLVVPHADGTLIAWNASTGAREVSVTSEVLNPHRAVFSPDGAVVVVWGSSPIAEVRDGRTLALVARLDVHKRPLTSVAISNELVALASRDKTITLWDRRTWKVTRHLQGDTNVVTRIVFDAGGHRLLSANRDGTARLWDVSTGALVLFLVGHRGTIRDCSFSSDGQKIVTASGDGTARVWDAASGVGLATYEGDERELTSLAVSRDKLMVVGADPFVRVFRLDLERRVVVDREIPSSIALSADSSWLASTGDEAARIYDRRTGAIVAQHPGVFDVLFHPVDPTRYLLVQPEALVLLENHQVEHHVKARVNVVRFFPDGERVAYGDHDNVLDIWNPRSSATTRFQGHTDKISSVDALGDLVVTGSHDKTARIWKLADRSVNTLQHERLVHVVAFDPTGAFVVTGSDELAAYIWDARTGKRLHTLRTEDITLGIAFSSQGQVVTYGLEPIAKVWNLQTGALEATLEGHVNPIGGAKFVSVPNADDLLVTIGDETFRVWDVSKSRVLQVSRGHTVQTRGLVVGGPEVITGGFDRVLSFETLSWQRRDLTSLHRLAECVPLRVVEGRMTSKAGCN